MGRDEGRKGAPAHGLGEHLRRRGADGIAALLRRRPDLLAPEGPEDLDDLVARAEDPASLLRALAATTRPEDQVLQVVACLPAGATEDDLARSLPEGVALGDVAPVLARLEDAGLAWCHDGLVVTPPSLPGLVPTDLGPSLQACEEAITLDHLKHAVRTLRVTLTEAGGVGELPPWASPPRKAGLLVELAGLLGADGAAAAAVGGAPPESAEILRAALDGPRPVVLDEALSFVRVAHRRTHQTAYRPASADTPAYWLFERGLLLPDPAPGGGARYVVPRELVLSWRAGRPVAAVELDAPGAVTGEADPDDVDAAAAVAVTRLLDRLDDLIDVWAVDPASTRRDGSLGVTAIRGLAARLDQGVAETARLVALAHLAGLVAPRGGDGTPSDAAGSVGVTPAASGWQASSTVRRWSQVATAWLRAATWPSAVGREADGVEGLAVLASDEPDDTAVPARTGLLAVLRGLAPGEATDPAALAARALWERPHHWRGLAFDPAVAAGWIDREAELLGLAAEGALSRFGRALLDGDGEGAEAALDEVVEPTITTVTLQADLTAMVLGRLDRDVMSELRLLAEVTSTGVATTFRFSEASLRRAFDAGRDAEAVVGFLEAHADRGVPPALAYLVADVARRHGHLVVAGVGSVVTADDPAVLADAASHRRARDLGLRVLAPTVAVSSQPPDLVLATLREMGFLPTSEGEEALRLEARGPVPEAEPALHEPFGAGPVAPAPPGEAEAHRMAEDLLARPPTTRAPGRPRR